MENERANADLNGLDVSVLRREWAAAGLNPSDATQASAIEEATRLAGFVMRLRALDDNLLSAQLKSTGEEDFMRLLEVEP